MLTTSFLRILRMAANFSSMTRWPKKFSELSLVTKKAKKFNLFGERVGEGLSCDCGSGRFSRVKLWISNQNGTVRPTTVRATWKFANQLGTLAACCKWGCVWMSWGTGVVWSLQITRRGDRLKVPVLLYHSATVPGRRKCRKNEVTKIRLQVKLQVLLGAQCCGFEPCQGSLRLSPTALKLKCFHLPIRACCAFNNGFCGRLTRLVIVLVL